jgi:hypothetical protein
VAGRKAQAVALKLWVTVLISGMLLAVVFISFSVAAQEPWSTKDWHQWTEKDCHQILTSSPWAKSLGEGADETRRDRISYVVQLLSALPIRQALARQWQIENRYDLMNSDQRRSADLRINEEIGQSYDDRIVVRLLIVLVDDPHPKNERVRNYFLLGPRLIFQNGQSMQPRDTSDDQVNSHGEGVSDSTFQRIRGGKPLIEPGDKKFKIDFYDPYPWEYVFDLRKMVYHGKLEY